MLGEPALRLKLRRLTGKVSVPILFHAGGVLEDSFKIARFADETGGGESLFPKEHLPDIVHWNSLSEKALSAGRVLVTTSVAADPDACMDSMPFKVPGNLSFVAPPVVQSAKVFLEMKYGFNDDMIAQCTKDLHQGLYTLRQSLRNKKYLVGGKFSYADITMAMLVQFVVPVANEHIKIRKNFRNAWTHTEFAEEFDYLVKWRDDLYAEHRGK